MEATPCCVGEWTLHSTMDGTCPVAWGTCAVCLASCAWVVPGYPGLTGPPCTCQGSLVDIFAGLPQH